MSTKKHIAFQALQPFPQIRAELDSAYRRVMDSGVYLFGGEVNMFKEEFISFLEDDGYADYYCVCLNSGFDALLVSLRALSIGYGDTVIVPANAPIPVYMAVTETGATPIPVDIELFSYNINAEMVESAIKSTTKAIIVVHLYGRPYDYMDWIIEIAAINNLYIIEDCSQAHGAEIETDRDYNNSIVGTLGDLSVFSFYPTKNMGAIGDSGVIVTSNEKIAEKSDKIKFYGAGEYRGINSRMDELQAAFLRVKLKHLQELNGIRKSNAQFYLENFPNNNSMYAPISHPGHVWHQFVIMHEERDKFIRHMKDCGVETAIHYPVPPYRMKVYNNRINCQNLTNTDYFSERCVSIPIAPHLTRKDLEYVVESMESYR